MLSENRIFIEVAALLLSSLGSQPHGFSPGDPGFAKSANGHQAPNLEMRMLGLPIDACVHVVPRLFSKAHGSDETCMTPSLYSVIT